jgi:hypothetical protein
MMAMILLVLAALSRVRISIRSSVRVDRRKTHRPARGAWQLGFSHPDFSGNDFPLAAARKTLALRRKAKPPEECNAHRNAAREAA